MDIPKCFSEKITRVFEEKGIQWLDELPNIINKCKEKWKLTNFRISNELSYNFVVFCESSHYGKVALKIGVPHPELYTEIKALSLYNGKDICKCYDYDIKNGAMLLERIVPGVDLTSIENVSDRILIGAELISKLNILVDENHELPSYTDWVNKAFKRAREENVVGRKMLNAIDRAENYYKELESLNRSKVLLHGDLHHYNILKCANGDWKAIDPKGVIGIPCLEGSRFIENQLRMVKDEEKLKYLDEMITVFSDKFNENKRIITMCLFVDFALSICWSFEDNDLREEISKSIKNLELTFSYIENI